MSDKSPQLTVVSAIIERARREVLICSRTAGADRMWEFPCGVKRDDETHEAAMRRVCEECVGLTIEIDVGQPPVAGEYDGQPATYRFFIAGVITGDAESRDYHEVRWVQRGQLCEYDFAEVTKPVVAWYLE